MNDIDEMCEAVHQLAKEKGWWEDGDRNMGEVTMNIASEVSEAWEEWRDGNMETYEDEKGKPCGYYSELADVVIRIGDLFAARGVSLSEEIKRKHAYNFGRAYKHGGKRA